MRYDFRWIDWNVAHIAKHEVSVAEAEFVVEHNRLLPIGDGKYIARGQSQHGRYMQVIFCLRRRWNDLRDSRAGFDRP